ncbi:MAG TPA: DRTGG domain-containing protein [Armatimonadota bacterium]|jgi:hypothetical protein
MVTLRDVVRKLELEVLTGEGLLDRPVSSGYAADLLSCVIARAKSGGVWVTLQSHANVVAVASLLGLAGVIVTEDGRPDDDILARAESEGVVLLGTPSTTFTVVGSLTALGVREASSAV